jgi:hypothetical protein
LVAIVYVTPAATVESKVTAPPNSVAEALNVIVCAAPEEKRRRAAKPHDPDVVEFVHDPLTVQDPPALVTNAFAAPMLTGPLTVMLEERELNSPNVPRVRLPAVTGRFEAEESTIV